MRRFLLIGAASLLSVSFALSPVAAYAQAVGAAATTTTDAPSSNGPAKGSNSFTQGQAASRIADAGFVNITGLKKDGNGVWRATATRNGQQVGVWLDYTGRVGQS